MAAEHSDDTLIVALGEMVAAKAGARHTGVKGECFSCLCHIAVLFFVGPPCSFSGALFIYFVAADYRGGGGF